MAEPDQRRARRREAEQRELAAAGEADDGGRAESAGRRRRRGGPAAEGVPSPSEEGGRDGGASLLGGGGGGVRDDGGEATTTVTSRRRRRQLELGEYPVDAQAASAGSRLWTRGDRASLVSEQQQAELLAALAAELEQTLDEQPSREVMPDPTGTSAPAVRLGYAASSRYAQDPVHGGFARKLHDHRSDDGAGRDDSLLVSSVAPGDSVAHSLARLVVSAVTLVRGLLAGLSLMHLFLISSLDSAGSVSAYAAYAPIALSVLALFQALIGVSLIASLDSNVMYTPPAAALERHAAGAHASASGSVGTASLALAYSCALLLGMLLLPLEQSLHYAYGGRRLPTGRLRADADLRELAALPWALDGGAGGGAALCEFGLLTCDAFTEERARLYRGLSVARDALCLVAYLVASLYFAGRPPPPRTYGSAELRPADLGGGGVREGEPVDIARVYARPAVAGGDQPLSPTAGLGV